MHIEKQTVFRFVFPFLGQDATFNIVAEDQPEAAEKLKKWMNDTMVELSIAFPKSGPTDTLKEKPKAMEELRIMALIAELDKYIPIPEGSSVAESVTRLVSTEYEPNNYPLIIDKLESLKNAYETGKIKKGGK